MEKEENVVCGTHAIDRLWRTLKDGIAGSTHTTDRNLVRIAAYAQAWRYRFLPGGQEPGRPYVVVEEMLQRFAAKRARGEATCLRRYSHTAQPWTCTLCPARVASVGASP